jgi:hypothetical protein
MIIRSPLSHKQYLKALKENLGHRDFTSERFSGIVVGRLFSITHTGEYHWNRRYRPKNNAFGYVKPLEDGCEIHCVLIPGYTSPGFILLMMLVAAFAFLISLARNPYLPANYWWVIAVATIVYTAIVCITTAVVTSLSDEGQESYDTLQDCLLDPTDPSI